MEAELAPTRYHRGLIAEMKAVIASG